MRPQNGGNPTVQIPPHQLFITGRFRMKINQNDTYIGRHLFQHFIDCLKRAVYRFHKYTSHQTDHRHLLPHIISDDCQTTAWCGFREICRLDNIHFRMKHGIDFPPAIDMVT